MSMFWPSYKDARKERRVPCKVRDSFAAKVEGEPEVLCAVCDDDVEARARLHGRSNEGKES